MDIAEIGRSFVELDGCHSDRFNEMARAAFEYQRQEGPVYARYCEDVVWTGWRSAPPLPVRAFKEVTVTTFPVTESERIFRSSATSSRGRSVHYVRSLEIYHMSLERQFESVFGGGPFTLVGHLPHYAEAGDESSLVYMVDRLIHRYGNEHSGFFLKDRSFLDKAVRSSEKSGEPLVLFGAAFGLLDLVDEAPVALPPSSIVIETGGMKTHRRNIARATLHQTLADGFAVPREHIYSEYGMCEMLSQCYTRGGAVFETPAWLRFRVLDPQNPFREVEPGQTGVLAFFDLANVHTVSALLTEDLAVQHAHGFEVLGRLAGSDIRGCNFLLEPAHRLAAG